MNPRFFYSVFLFAQCHTLCFEPFTLSLHTPGRYAEEKYPSLFFHSFLDAFSSSSGEFLLFCGELLSRPAVPPPPENVAEAMSDLELFIHNKGKRMPILIKAALAHAQFETIHFFLDGNGTVGRLLIPLLLCLDGVLKEPLLYLSLYFKTHRSQYYDLLNAVRIEGDWERWIRFFSEGVREMAENAVQAVRRLAEMAARDREHIRQLGRVSGSSLQIHHALQTRPLSTIASLTVDTNLSVPTVTKAIQALESEGLVREITGRKRGRVYSYHGYLSIMNEE